MIVRSPIAMAVLLAALAACDATTTPSTHAVRDEAAIRASEGNWVAAVQTRRFERSFRAAAQK